MVLSYLNKNKIRNIAKKVLYIQNYKIYQFYYISFIICSVNCSNIFTKIVQLKNINNILTNIQTKKINCYKKFKHFH